VGGRSESVKREEEGKIRIEAMIQGFSTHGEKFACGQRTDYKTILLI